MKNLQRLMLSLSTALFLCLTAVRAQHYSIYPIPHSTEMGTQHLRITPQVAIVADATIDPATTQRATRLLQAHGYEATLSEAASSTHTTLYLGTIGSQGKAEQAAVTQAGLVPNRIRQAGKYDRHAVALTSQHIYILGEHTNATFCGLASLEQILEQPAEDGTYPTTVLYDYADQQNRGLVEGYYGYPYTVSVKKDLMRFMMRYKMNTYLYGAKSDPYHSQMWQEAYPTHITAQQEKNGWLSQSMVQELAQESYETKVNFIWAIHPGNAFLGSPTVVSDIMAKFDKMHQLGVRQFAIFVDDVSIPSSDSDMKLNADRLTAVQQAIETKWNTPTAQPADTVRPLHFVPQIYCSSFASSNDQRIRFMKALGKTPSYITIYTTGQAVWTVPNSEHMNQMHQELGRDMAWWWNYPCNDNADGQIYTMDMYSNFYDLPQVDGNARMPQSLTHTLGVVSNPMQEGEVSKTSLFSVADYAWNNAGFQHQKSWEASFQPLISQEHIRQAYRYLTSYLRWNEPSTLNALISQYKTSLTRHQPNDTALRDLLHTLSAHCETVESLHTSPIESDRLLYTDLRPWLHKLHADVRALLTLLDAAKGDDTAAQWHAYLDALDQIDSLQHSTRFTAYALEGMGHGISVSQRQAQVSQLYLEPFLHYMKEHATQGFLVNQQPSTKATYLTNRAGLTPTIITQSQLRTVTLTTPARSYAPGEYVGIALPQAIYLDDIRIADTLFQQHTLLWSADGKQWTRVTDAHPSLTSPLRYLIVLNNTDAPRSFRLTSSSVVLTLPQQTHIRGVEIPAGNVWDNHHKGLIIDGDYSTFCTLSRNQQVNDYYTVDLGESLPIHDVRLCIGTTNGDYPRQARVKVSEDGNKWYVLRVKGVSDSFEYTMDLPQNVRYSDEMTYCDFEGRGRTARYVRLDLTQPHEDRWFRLYEIEVNKQYDQSRYRALCTDQQGTNCPEVSDGNGATFLHAQAQSPLLFHLDKMAKIEAVEVFSSPQSDVQLILSVTQDGTTWTEVAPLTQAYQRIDLSPYPHAIALSIHWTSSKAPRLHEMVPYYTDALPLSLPTGLHKWRDERGEQEGTSHAVYDLQGRRQVGTPRRGIYIIQHKKVIK